MEMPASARTRNSTPAWHELYQAALFENDHKKLPDLITMAERAILARMKEVFTLTTDHIEEDQYLDDALYALRALRNCVVPEKTAA